MRSIFAKSGLVAVASAVGSLGVAAIVLKGLGIPFNGTAFLMSTLCPLLVAWPASARGFLQKRRIVAAHDEVAKAHGELARAHAELANAHVRLAERARLDAMTGLLNRESFMEAVMAEQGRRRSGVLLIIDADHFKSINDNHGHATGDAALVEVARAIRRKAGPEGIVGRIGGEEFAVSIPDSGNAFVHAITETIRREVARISMKSQGGAALKLSVSIGGAESARDIPMEQVARNADSRLHAAKRMGRDTIVLHDISVSSAA